MKELANFAEERWDRSRIFQLSSYAPEMNPAEGIWSLLKRHLAHVAAAELTHLTHLTRLIKRKLKKTPYRPLVDGCLPPTDLTMADHGIRPPDSTSQLSTWPDRRLGPQPVQRDRFRRELRRIVLHDDEMSASGSSVSCVQDQGARPVGDLTLQGGHQQLLGQLLQQTALAGRPHPAVLATGHQLLDQGVVQVSSTGTSRAP